MQWLYEEKPKHDMMIDSGFSQVVEQTGHNPEVSNTYGSITSTIIMSSAHGAQFINRESHVVVTFIFH